MKRLRSIKQGLYRRINQAVPIKWTTSLEHARNHPEDWLELVPAGAPDWPQSIRSGVVPEELHPYLPTQREPLGLLTLRNAWVSGDDGWVYDASGHRYLDLSGYHALHADAPRLRLPWPRSRRQKFSGTTLTLLSPFSPRNFFHYVMDSLSRLHLLAASQLTWNEIDQVLVPEFNTPSAQRWLKLSGIPTDKIILIRNNDTVLIQAERLLCPSYPAIRRTCSKSSVSYLRGLLGADKTPPGTRRLFIQRRSHARHMENEAEVWALLQPLGFELVNPSTTTNTEALFSQAACVVADHGAALTNLLHCPQGTQVLELIPSDQTYPHYFTLSNHAGLDYDALICPSNSVRKRPINQPYHSNFNFKVELHALRKKLDIMNLG